MHSDEDDNTDDYDNDEVYMMTLGGNFIFTYILT